MVFAKRISRAQRIFTSSRNHSKNSRMKSQQWQQHLSACALLLSLPQHFYTNCEDQHFILNSIIVWARFTSQTKLNYACASQLNKLKLLQNMIKHHAGNYHLWAFTSYCHRMLVLNVVISSSSSSPNSVVSDSNAF